MQDQFDVAEVQRQLGVPADGELGPVTAAAIAAWKRSRGLRGEGLAPAEYKRLLADVPLLAVRQMERWVGLHEVPRGSNRVPELVALAGRLGVPASLGADGVPLVRVRVFLAALAHGGEAAARGLRRQRVQRGLHARRSWRPRRRDLRPAGRPRRRSPSAATSFSSTGISATATLWITWAGWWTALWTGVCGRWTATPAATVSLPAETAKMALFGHLFGIRDDPPRIGGR